MKKWLLKPPRSGEAVRLLQAWRVWLVGGVLGALLALALHGLFPPPFRAAASLLVDHNAEQVVPAENPDREVFYYIQRETDKLIAIAWSDAVLAQVGVQTGLAVADLRNGILHLTQSGDGVWHFQADAATGAEAERLASTWALAFLDAVRAGGEGISPVLEVVPVQVQDLPIQPARALAVSLFGGALAGMALLAFLVLFFDRKEN